MNLIISKFRFATFNILGQRTLKQGEVSVNLYQSKIEEKHLSNFQANYTPFHEYYQLLPFFMEKFIYNHRKQFVTKMDFYKESNLLQLTCLTHSGLFLKTVNPENIVPVTYGDYKNACTRNLFRHPIIVDHEMIYYNKLQQEFYCFDRQGLWNETNEDALTLGKLWDERKFQDQYFL